LTEERKLVLYNKLRSLRDRGFSFIEHYRKPEQIARLVYNNMKVEGLHPNYDRLLEHAKEQLEEERG
jgi:hypothetical protein